MIDKAKNWEKIELSDEFYKHECKRIFEEYPEEMERVMGYDKCELENDFLGFLHVYGTVEVPRDFTVIDLGCSQAVQAQYFEHCERYISVDDDCPIEARFRQNNAEHYACSIQDFIRTELPKLIENGLDLGKTFAVCSYVPDEEARELVAATFPFCRVVYCDKILKESKPPVLNYLSCLNLLEACVREDLLAVDPNNKDNILVWAKEGGLRGREGWQSRNAHDIAQELLHDGEGQRFLMTELAKNEYKFFASDFVSEFQTKFYPIYDDEFYENVRPRRVFVSGSHSIGKLPEDAELFLRECMDNGDKILVGDCPVGVDATVQHFLAMQDYKNVEVYSSGEPRHLETVDFRGNPLPWKVNKLDVPKELTGRDYYTFKDIKMTEECDKALTVWDGKSKGTKNNINRLKEQGKECAVCKFSWTLEIEK